MNPTLAAGLKYFLRFFLLYSILTAISFVPSVVQFFNAAYCAPTELGLGWVFPSAFTKVKPSPRDPGVLLVEFVSQKKVEELKRQRKLNPQIKTRNVSGHVYEFKFYNLFLGFYIFFLALILLSPIPWKELIIGLVAGTLLFYLYTFVRVVHTLFIFFNDAKVGIFETNPGTLNFLKKLLELQTVGMSAIVILIIWAVLVFRKGNWKTIFNQA